MNGNSLRPLPATMKGTVQPPAVTQRTQRLHTSFSAALRQHRKPLQGGRLTGTPPHPAQQDTVSSPTTPKHPLEGASPDAPITVAGRFSVRQETHPPIRLPMEIGALVPADGREKVADFLEGGKGCCQVGVVLNDDFNGSLCCVVCSLFLRSWFDTCGDGRAAGKEAQG